MQKALQYFSAFRQYKNTTDIQRRRFSNITVELSVFTS